MRRARAAAPLHGGKPRWRGLLAALGLLALSLSSATALANGGTLQVSEAPAGPYRLSVYTSPSPLRVGTADVSVLVQQADSDELVEGARIAVTAEPLDRAGTAGTYPASHDQATNKLFQAAHVPLDQAGRWRLTVAVSGQAGAGQVEFEVHAGEPGLLDSPLVLVALVLIPILVLLWLIRRSTGRPAASPRARRPGSKT